MASSIRSNTTMKIRPTTTTTISSTTITTSTLLLLPEEEYVFIGALDQLVAKGFRLWMLLAMIFAVLLILMIIVCCFIKIRIPRSKREMDLEAAHRRQRRPSKPVDLRNYEPPDRGGGCKVIVMTTAPSNQSLLSPPPNPDAESISISCTSCATTSEHSRNHTPTNGSKDSLDQPQQPHHHQQQLLQMQQQSERRQSAPTAVATVKLTTV